VSGRHRFTRAGLQAEVVRLRSRLRTQIRRGDRFEAQLHQERVAHAEETQAADRKINRLQAANRAWEAQYANEHPVTVQAPKDLRLADDRPTVPHGIDVRPLPQLLREFGPIIPVPVPAEAVGPSHIPAAA
jgi:hypothetical protein